MALDAKYPEKFERLWKVYPKWPKGRSKKATAGKAYNNANRVLKFTDEDIDFIVRDIEQRIRTCKTWQKDSRFGPPMLSTYINQRHWNEPYEKVNRRINGVEHSPTVGMELSEEENARRFWIKEHAAGRPVPEKYQHYLPHH